MNDEQGPSGSGKNEKPDDEAKEDRQPEQRWSRIPTKREGTTTEPQ